METQRKKKTQTQRQKNVITMTSGGFVIAVRDNVTLSAFFRAYLVTILKALVVACCHS